MNEQIYDLVLCVGRQHLDISKITLRFIKSFLNPGKIYLVTNKEHFNSYRDVITDDDNIKLVDERSFADIQYDEICSYIQSKTGSSKRTGWYFQQFIKMQAHEFVEADFYLIWDADTIPLKPINFFNKDRQILIHPGKEYHLPYFHTLKNLLGLDKNVEYSFISEHMMVKKAEMESFIELIKKNSSKDFWPLIILKNIDVQSLQFSGFSEYESFGNFLSRFKPDSFIVRENEIEKIISYRFGTKIFGKIPSDIELGMLERLGLHCITFETWDTINSKVIHRNKRLAKLWEIIIRYRFTFLENKILSKIKKQMVS